MKVERIENDPDLILYDTGGERAPGLHLSDIIKKEMFRRDRKFNPDNPLDMMTLEVGHTWEEVLAHALHRRELKGGPKAGYRPEQFQYAGVWMSPDWLNPGNEEFPLEEWKATKASKRKDLLDDPDPKHWYWFPQFMGYAKGVSERLGIPVRGCIVRVWYINGDYTYESKNGEHTMLRDYVKYRVSFSQQEVDDNWRKLMSMARRDGLLKEEEPTWEQPGPQPRQTPLRKPSSPSRPPSRARKVITFPTTRMSLKRPDA